MQKEFEEKLQQLMTSTTSPRDLIEMSENLRKQYEQD